MLKYTKYSSRDLQIMHRIDSIKNVSSCFSACISQKHMDKRNKRNFFFSYFRFLFPLCVSE